MSMDNFKPSIRDYISVPNINNGFDSRVKNQNKSERVKNNGVF